MSGFRFRLYSAEMDELGEFETVVPNWSKGDEFLMATVGASASSGSSRYPMTSASSMRSGRSNR